jgi:hypothetical protein
LNLSQKIKIEILNSASMDVPEIILYNSSFKFTDYSRNTTIKENLFPLDCFFFGRKESQHGLAQNENSLFYFVKNENISREHFRLNFRDCFEFQYEITHFQNYLKRNGYFVCENILSLISEFLGKGMYIRVKEMGSISGSWLISYNKQIQSNSPSSDHKVKYFYFFIQFKFENLKSKNSQFKMNPQNFNINLKQNNKVFSNKNWLRLLKGFTYRGQNDETIEIFQIFKKRKNILKRDRIQHILDLDDYFGLTQINCEHSNLKMINQTEKLYIDSSEIFKKKSHQTKNQTIIKQQDSKSFIKKVSQEKQFYRKIRNINQKHILDSLKDIKAIMSNKGELGIQEFIKNILPDLLNKECFEFDLILLHYDASYKYNSSTSIALLVVNSSFCNFEVKGFPIMFVKDAFYVRKKFGIDDTTVDKLCSSFGSNDYNFDTIKLANQMFQTPKNMSFMDVEEKISKGLSHGRVCLGFSIRQQARFIPKSWIFKIQDSGQLIFMIDNVLLKISFWNYLNKKK